MCKCSNKECHNLHERSNLSVLVLDKNPGSEGLHDWFHRVFSRQNPSIQSVTIEPGNDIEGDYFAILSSDPYMSIETLLVLYEGFVNSLNQVKFDTVEVLN